MGSVKGRFEEEEVVKGRLEGVVVGSGSAGLVLAFWGFCLLGLPPPPLGALVLGSSAVAAGAGDLEGSGSAAGGSVAGSGSPAVTAVVMVAGRPISLKRVSTSGSVRGAREVAISVKVLPLPLRWRIAMSSAVVQGAGGVGSAGGAGGVGSAGGAGSGAAGAWVGDVVAVGGLRRWVGGEVSWWVGEGVRRCQRGRIWGLEVWGGLGEGMGGGEVGISCFLCEDLIVMIVQNGYNY